MPDLMAQALAKLDERERLARAAAGLTTGVWHTHASTLAWGTVSGEGFDVVSGGDPQLDPDDAQHIAASDPATVLRECEAWRSLLSRHQPFGKILSRFINSDLSNQCITCGIAVTDRGFVATDSGLLIGWPCLTVDIIFRALGVTE